MTKSLIHEVPAGTPAVTRLPSWRRVVACYSAVDRFFPACEIWDLTEGIYGGKPQTPYTQAQTRQHDYLLDQAGCGPGSRLLDLGCGYGTLLARAQQRGAAGVGITISPEQVRHGQRQQLNVQLLDYLAIPADWQASFDSVIANGSIEHFVRPADAAAGGADEVYRRMFAGVHALIDPHSPARRFVTTTIHFMRKPADPGDLLRSPWAYSWGSDSFHWAMLERGWGGYYPELGQLERCARGYFDLIEEVDGTQDYFWTSEEWMRRVRRAILSLRVVPIAVRSLPVLARAPRQFLALLIVVFLSDSWTWQFRPPDPPTRLLRQTWSYRDR
jgi:cyclopropane fatty-acyl-phospholipid synthase-like methyltransferase